jgi:hypothetical protein
MDNLAKLDYFSGAVLIAREGRVLLRRDEDLRLRHDDGHGDTTTCTPVCDSVSGSKVAHLLPETRTGSRTILKM